MKLTLSFEERDYVQSYLYDWSYSPLRKKQRIRIVGYALFSIIVFTLLIGSKDVVAGAVSFIMLGTYLIWYLKTGIKKSNTEHYQKYVTEKLSSVFGKDTHIEIHDDYIFNYDDTGEAKLYTTNIEELIETREYFYIRLKTSNKIIIPKRQVSNHEQFLDKMNEIGFCPRKDLEWEW